MKTVIPVEKAPLLAPYFATLYYVNILFLLPRMGFFFGKTAAVTVILLLAALWTCHVIALNSGKEINRKIHLVFMEVDFALRLPFLVNFVFFMDLVAYWFETVFFVINLITLISALAFIILLTDERVKRFYR
jgi:hypothetical protein